jgi:hypothetical protein
MPFLYKYSEVKSLLFNLLFIFLFRIQAKKIQYKDVITIFTDLFYYFLLQGKKLYGLYANDS